MIAVQSQPLGRKWKDRLNLTTRRIPEFYENAEDVRSTPHAGAIRAALGELGASAVFCVQGVPTIVILSVDEYDRETIIDLHAALWNQGLASLLLVISRDTVRAFSLARIPYSGETHDFDDRCLIRELNAVSHALLLKDIVYSAESGRLWEEYGEYFRSKERVDHVLLGNLTQSHKSLCKCKNGLSSDEAQALLIQTMFVAYLEDREIIGKEYFLSASDNHADSFLALLNLEKVNLLARLFESLRSDFNGDLFVAPCSFEESGSKPLLASIHLKILTRFRSGREEIHGDTSQYRFWGYNFKYIPIELISAVYDRFLGENKTEQRVKGAYYTPMFLADTVISHVWDTLSPATRDKGYFLDPACGSGVFLVRSFQRLCEHWRETRKSRKIRWDSLLAILSRLHGWDIDSGAVRVAVFALYVALLEEVTPPDISFLIKRGKFLPELWDCNLRNQDFFAIHPVEGQFDVLIGNPPWSSRRGANRSSVEWCKAERLPMPSKEDAWSFVWKSLRHLRQSGTVAFLLPAMGFLHNHADYTISARNRFLREARISRIINFCDLRFQLFEHAVRPAALIVFGHPHQTHQESQVYRFDYWVPKADLNLKANRLITLTNDDKRLISSHMVEEDPVIFKRCLWMNDPEAKLFSYLSTFPKLGDFVDEYGDLKRGRKEDGRKKARSGWIIGQGFQPVSADRLSDPNGKYQHSEAVAKTPYLPISDFRALSQISDGLEPWGNSIVRRRGFEDGFTAPRILIPRGVDTIRRRLRAAYVEGPLTFQDIIQALVFPRGEERRAKLLTALLNSKLAVWFAFHGTASFGSERPEVSQAELLRFPFPSSSDMTESERSKAAENDLVSLIDQAIDVTSDPLIFQVREVDIFGQLDQLTYEYFCLSDDEIILVDDTVEWIIPSVQPNKGRSPDIWRSADLKDRQTYATTLVRSMTEWFDRDCVIEIKLEARSDDLAVLRLTLETEQGNAGYFEENDKAIGDVVTSLFEHIHQPLSGNFQLMPDFRIFIGNHLYLIKPAQKRFWLKSAALADADAIALDLHDAVVRINRSRA